MKNKKIIAIDDQLEILDAYKSILTDQNNSKDILDELELDLFEDNDEQTLEDEETYELDTATQGIEGVEKIKRSIAESRPYAVVFIDMRMPPGIDGKETAKLIRELDRNIEIVFVTAYSDHNRKHLVDYIGTPNKLLFLKKPFDVDEIKQFALALTEKWNVNYEKKLADKELRTYNSRLEQTVEEKTAQLRETIKKLEILSNTDPMTGLYNFRKFREQLGMEISRVNRFEEKHKNEKYTFSIAILDLDNFKIINDTFGHLTGDMVLQNVAHVLRENCREIDIISRYGGDEFIIIFVDCDAISANDSCERILENLKTKMTYKQMLAGKNEIQISDIRKKIAFESFEQNFPIKCSIGISQFSKGLKSEEIIGKADSALYESKMKGKDSITICF